MLARRKRVISTEEIQFNHKPIKLLLTKKRRESAKMAIPQVSIIGICSYCVLDRPVFEWCQTLLHPELTPWWSFLLADGTHHKKPHSPTHPIHLPGANEFTMMIAHSWLQPKHCLFWESIFSFSTNESPCYAMLTLALKHLSKDLTDD